ncbi:MAG: hypothetical protein JNL79_31090 [Myxococcales bacterium]|nr:hypothetical protein [Myxococcales bacterium]
MGRFDPIGIVEAAYRVGGTDAEWLDDIVAAARPCLDAGLGTVAWMLSFDPTFAASAPAGEGPEGWREAFFAHGPALRPDQLDRQYRAGCGTLREVTMGTYEGDAYVKRYLSPMGIADFVAITGRDVAGHGVFLGAPTPKPIDLSDGRRATWSRVAAHLTAGLRLRRTIGAEVDAVIDGERVVHAEHEGRSANARERLRAAARAIDKARGKLRSREPESAVELWTGLVSGRWTLVDRVESDGRRLLIARRNSPTPTCARALSLRERQVVGYALLGFTNKQTAYALGLTPSAISMCLRGALRKLGSNRIEDLRS